MLELFTWLFPVAVSLHNLEEGLSFPRYAHLFAPWRRVHVSAFRFALVLLTLLAYLSALWSTLGGARSVGAYLHAGYMLTMLLNVLIPHLAVSVAQGRLMPGTATGVLLVLPTTLTGLYLGLSRSGLEPFPLVRYGGAVTLALLASLPLLFKLGALFGNART